MSFSVIVKLIILPTDCVWPASDLYILLSLFRGGTCHANLHLWEHLRLSFANDFLIQTLCVALLAHDPVLTDLFGCFNTFFELQFPSTFEAKTPRRYSFLSYTNFDLFFYNQIIYASSLLLLLASRKSS